MSKKTIFKLIYDNCSLFCDNDCPASGSRCCVRKSCVLVRNYECKEETKKLFDESKDIPFLGNNGCVVPPEERPYCTTFVCDVFAGEAKKRYKHHLHLIGLLSMRDAQRYKRNLRNIQQFMKKFHI